MHDAKKILKEFKARNTQWSSYSRFLELEESELKPFFNLARNNSYQNFGNILKIYIPNKNFPSISVTGSSCALECEHCNTKYLDSMQPILNNVELETFLLDLADKGAVGVLLSGGCDSEGSVPLLNFLDTIKKVKNQTNLIINTHTGLLNKKTAKKLKEAKIDIVSFDINIDQEIIRDIYHLDKDLNDYKNALNLLKNEGLNIVPHLCIGLHYGKLHKELESLKIIKELDLNPSLIVLIALIPPKEKDNFTRPKPIDIAKICALVRFIFPETEISLGCMRPRADVKVEIEKLAIQAGINRIEIPSTHTIKWLKKVNPEISLRYFSACCAIPNELENLAKSKDSDIKRYLKI